VRKKCWRLEQIRNVAFLRPKINSGGGILQNAFAQRNSRVMRFQQARDAIQQCGFSCPRWTEQDGDAGSDFKVNVQSECALASSLPPKSEACSQRTASRFTGG